VETVAQSRRATHGDRGPFRPDHEWPLVPSPLVALSSPSEFVLIVDISSD
jgi:hypothetical protein